MTTTAFVGGTIHTLTAPADWVLVDGGKTAATGRGEAPSADRTVSLDGAVMVPAFCDAHVHLPATGLYASGLDLRGEKSASRILEAFAGLAGGSSKILFGGNFEDPLDEPLAGSDLDKAVGDRPALLMRADMHSCIVSTALLDKLDIEGLQGVDLDEGGRPTGYLRERAAAAAWREFEAGLGLAELASAFGAAVRHAYSKGVASVHEMYVADWRGWGALELLTTAAGNYSLDVVCYVATTEIDRLVDLGLPRIGGDLFLDGSFGSRTAWMTRPYTSAPPSGTPANGMSYLEDGDLQEFFSAAQAAALQTGVHAIGDAAIEQAISAWEKVAANVGVDAVRSLAHRIEHFECAGDDHIARAKALGLGASVQPAFDYFWGGADGLYSDRIGPERAAGMNRFKSMLDAGLTVGAGSDSTVTPLDPFLQMAALRSHHQPQQRMDAGQALALHTLGSRSLASSPAGEIAAGNPADFAVLDRDPLLVDDEELLDTQVLATFIAGNKVHPEDEAETS